MFLLITFYAINLLEDYALLISKKYLSENKITYQTFILYS